ncbi:class I SAM-dependent methyltransferase [Myroides pelagicus]|uniref:O-methyltransferase n=1 Tax=Myroides pelagicus TaxID=270914 RepID=UPI002DB722A4|nr:class I SAM-dependent methyltransferase [Myroides pelagicus]MEC4113410.1 class I SAM-dependent methyltransferase [Myroides pelagicus]
MNKQTKQEILRLYKTFQEEDSTKENRLDRWRNLEPESAELLSTIVKTQQFRNLLEIGTSNGFSTLWLADAALSTAGKLTTLEIDATRTAKAREHLAQFDLLSPVTLLTLDAKAFLETADPVFDFIFLDAQRSYYTSYWPDLKRLLQTPNSLLIVDNAVSHHDQVSDFIALIQREGVYTTHVDPVGAGLLFVSKK